MKNVKIENGSLLRNEQVLIKVGDSFIEKLNSFRKYKVTNIDLHFITFEKTEVGKFEQSERGTFVQRQTVHFLENDFDLKRIN